MVSRWALARLGLAVGNSPHSRHGATRWRRLLVGLIVLLIAAPAAFVGFAMALLVVEFVI